MPTIVEAFLQHFTYLALILILLAAGFGAPIPEDLPLAFSGYLCNPDHSPIKLVPEMQDLDHDGRAETKVMVRDPNKHVPNKWIMIIAGMVGVLVGDTFVFHVGRRGIDTDNFIARHIRKVMHSKRRAKAERHFSKYGSLTVFAGRFMPGLRSLVFAMAGMSKMSYLKFILIDGMAALISVPAFVLLGYFFAEDINKLFAEMAHYKHIIGGVAVVLLAVAGVLYYVRKHRPQEALVEDSVPH